jgi:hypothetical protein
MHRRIGCTLALTFTLLATAEAHAHFLFIHIGPPAEGGRAAEVYFSEQATAGDPRFVDKIAGTRLWMQTTPGKFQELHVQKGPDRLRALVPVSGSVVVVGRCDYGVLARPGQTPFLLRHYPRAMAGSPDALNAMRPHEHTPLEIVARLDGDRIHLTALRHGKPVPRAVFHTVDSSLGNQDLAADADGRATWKPPSPDRYAVYTSQVLKEPGTWKGQRYDEVREFATLAFTWPLERRGADAKAVALFQEALATRAQWKDFPGFRAGIAGTVDGRAFDGKVAVRPTGAVRLEVDDPAVKSWVKGQLESIVLHRAAGDSSGETPVLRFADRDTDHPLGRLLLFEGGRFASSYRVKDKQITVVNRYTARQNMTITVQDNQRNADDRFLPHTYTVQWWEAGTGKLLRTETVQDRWRRVGAFDLPAERTIITASDAGLSVRRFTLSQQELTTAQTRAGKVHRTRATRGGTP